ncbi:UNVERIFIED_CONTAM: hypothetical protein Slati_0460300 [Sesamum latifolium]|uniref:Aminotransferase-like plant mobile domain-containing protein n=1 Tax=Sesamum latifolium TaxID=2727402 RepID=A0AAW2XX14_9LAMI
MTKLFHVLRSLTVLTRRDEGLYLALASSCFMPIICSNEIMMAINFLKSLLTSGSNFGLKESRSTVSLPHVKRRRRFAPNRLTILPGLLVHGKWSSAEEALFSKLGIEGSLKEEMFLAAYLTCWLCTFALPTDGAGLIRPSTFKVASIMAAGRRVGLAVPVLASIYKSLNKISDSLRLIRVPSPFPIHFVYSWIAHYFKTHYQVLQGVRGPKMTLFSGEGGAKCYDPQEARKQIHKGDFVSWTCNMIVKDKDFSFVDDGHAKDFEEAYFMAIRSNYLPLWQGDYFDVEPYNPHRFGHQFGFFQEVPEILSQDVRRASLKDGIRYWRLCISSKTMKNVWFPSMQRSFLRGVQRMVDRDSRWFP